MYEESKDLITEELKAIANREGIAAAIDLVNKKTNTAIYSLVAAARLRIEETSNSSQKEEIKKEADKLLFLCAKHSNLLNELKGIEKKIPTNEIWIDINKPFNINSTESPIKVKEIYARAKVILSQMERQAMLVFSQLKD